MIFSTEKAFNIEKKDVAYLEAGIHEDVAYTGIRKEKSQNGNSFIEFEFDKNGERLTHTEWEPTKRSDQSDEEFNSKVNNQVARILQILGAFYAKEQLSFNADTFDQFAGWVKTLMDAVDKDAKVRLKAIYGQTGFVSLPKYAKYTFIENMRIGKDESKIKKLQIDTFERPEMGDVEVPTKTAASTFGGVSSTTPF